MNAAKRAGLGTRVTIALVTVAFVVAIFSTAASAYVAQPKLELTFDGYETNQNFRFAIFTLRNVGTAAAMYRGYSKERPSFNLVNRSAGGAWSPRILMCGTGIINCLLLPGEQITTKEAIVEEENWMLSLSYTKPTFYDRLPREIQSWLPLRERSSRFRKVSTPEIGGLPRIGSVSLNQQYLAEVLRVALKGEERILQQDEVAAGSGVESGK